MKLDQLLNQILARVSGYLKAGPAGYNDLDLLVNGNMPPYRIGKSANEFL
jgi:hypothetical protein